MMEGVEFYPQNCLLFSVLEASKDPPTGQVCVRRRRGDTPRLKLKAELLQG